MPLYAVILVALVVVLLPLTFLLANYRYEVACLAAESCPESRPRTTFCAAIADQPLLLLPHPSRRWKYTGLRCGMCWTRTRRIYEAKAVTRSLSHTRVSINEADDDDGGYAALADTETANDPRVGKQVLHIAVMKL